MAVSIPADISEQAAVSYLLHYLFILLVGRSVRLQLLDDRAPVDYSHTCRDWSLPRNSCHRSARQQRRVGNKL